MVTLGRCCSALGYQRVSFTCKAPTSPLFRDPSPERVIGREENRRSLMQRNLVSLLWLPWWVSPYPSTTCQRHRSQSFGRKDQSRPPLIPKSATITPPFTLPFCSLVLRKRLFVQLKTCQRLTCAVNQPYEECMALRFPV